MSTRSGRRLNRSHEKLTDDEPKIEFKSEKKTRSRRGKDENPITTSVVKSKKHYVKYPSTDEDQVDGTQDEKPKSRKTLKESNQIVAEVNSDDVKGVRQTRRTRRFADVEEDAPEVQVTEPKKGKRNKKKQEDVVDKENEMKIIPEETNKTKKRKKGKNVTPIKETENKTKLETSSASVESFHSAVGSPKDQAPVKLNGTFDKTPQEEVVEVPTNTNKKGKKKTGRGKAKEEPKAALNSTFDKSDSDDIKIVNTTFEKEPSQSKNTSKVATPKLNSTFDKEKVNTTFEKEKSQPEPKSDNSVINLTFDKSSDSLTKISLTSDESKTENILNTSPVLIDSSMDCTFEAEPKKSLQREGTFTKDGPDPIIITEKIKTPQSKQSVSSPGRTPYHSGNKVSRKLNKTHSVEKPFTRLSVCQEPTRATKVMFCSPVKNPTFTSQRQSKIIKSSMKGSNKSFVFQDNSSDRPSARKRSFTQNDAEEVTAKRKKLADSVLESVNRLSRPRSSSVSTKLETTTPNKFTPAKKVSTPAPTKSEIKRSKLPNFAALHRKQFDMMESLGECQERRAKRAKQLLAPKRSLVLEKSAQKAQVKTLTKDKKSPPKNAKPAYTRFGFKINLDFNPFSIPSVKKDPSTKEPEKINGNLKAVKNIKVSALKREKSQPSLQGATNRKEVAKQTLLREKSFTEIRESKRNECRTVIKGVRTNRRFELQMKSRNI